MKHKHEKEEMPAKKKEMHGKMHEAKKHGMHAMKKHHKKAK